MSEVVSMLSLRKSKSIRKSAGALLPALFYWAAIIIFTAESFMAGKKTEVCKNG
ncbi:MAG: hypothetical protein LBG29_00550 [Synergistaceae bacterium]|jgi:hypothetical protein|nr:hypothetical protein [Synergistaceae bacterium]